jgi:type I restriction enzyme S subunit
MKEVALGTIGNINPRKPQGLDPESKCSFVPMDHVDDQFGIIAETSERQVADVESGYTYFQESDVLFAKITPCMENGKCAIARNLTNGIGFGSTEFHVIRAKESAIPEWIYYYLRQETTREEARRSMTGSAGQRRVPSGFLRDALIPLPPLPEQQRIAAILGRADRLRRLRRTARELGDTYLQSVFLEMFGDPVTNPMGWETVKLGKIASANRGKFSPRPRNDPRYYGGQYPFIQTGDIASSDGFLTQWNQTLNEDGTKVSRAFDVGTVVIAIVGATIGETAILGIKAYCPDSVIGMEVEPKSSTPEYIEHLLRFWKPIFRAQAPETARANINLGTLRPLPVILPPLPLQQQFTHIVRKFERLRTQQRKAERQAEHLFQALLHRAFRGKV